MKFPSKKEIVEANRKATAVNGDPFVVSNEAAVEHLVDALKYKYNDKPEREALLLKAAYLLNFVAGKAHAFVEGNKRTAVTLTLAFLKRNGLPLDTRDQEELVKFTLSVASGKESTSSVKRWLEQRIKIRP
ncbi:MAG: type II toxin-antitoxin system death-on-curing family toxin [Candidatus Micrarchaeota archaeon]